MLHNRARHLKLPPPPDDSDTDREDDDAGNEENDENDHQNVNERAKTAAGNRTREKIINDNFS